MKRLRIGTAALVISIASIAAMAADSGHGEKLAKDRCSSCHLVTPDQTSGGDGAPTFGSIADTIAETSAERSSDLRAWLADPHPPMPNLDLTVREIDDLLAFIDSQRDR